MELVRHTVAVVIVYLCLLTLTCPASGNALTLEEELQELTENYVRQLLNIYTYVSCCRLGLECL